MESLNETKLNNETNDMTIELNNLPVNNEETSPETNNNEKKESNPKSNNNTTQASKTHKVIKDDIVCQVCNDGDYSEDNMIVFCSVENSSINKLALNYFKRNATFRFTKNATSFQKYQWEIGFVLSVRLSVQKGNF